MNTDLIATAVAQLASIMAADWTLTEAVGAKVKRIGKFWIAQILGAMLSMIAYGLGWFNALPSVAASGHPLTGWRGYISAAFAGTIGAILTSGAHKVLVGSRSKSNGVQPPA